MDCIPVFYRDGAGRYNIGMGFGNRTASGIHRCTTGMNVVSGLPGDAERNTRRYTDFTVGEAKTSFARQGYRENWGFDGRCCCDVGNRVERCEGFYICATLPNSCCTRMIVAAGLEISECAVNLYGFKNVKGCFCRGE